MTAPLIRTEGLGRDYVVGSQVVHALRDLDVTVERGELLAIVGPSGSGKSTCMQLLGCLDTPTAGRYVLDGCDVSLLDGDAMAETRNRKIGLVFQAFNLLPGATALRNVEMPLVYGRHDRRERKARAEAALEAVGLADRMDHLPSQLSGGQMQRVAIARALVNSPLLILADEPTGALDSATGKEILALFHRLNERGITIVLVTHDADVAASTDRILRFHDGRLLSDKTISPADGASA